MRYASAALSLALLIAAPAAAARTGGPTPAALLAKAKTVEATGDMKAALAAVSGAVDAARTAGNRPLLAEALRLQADYLSGFDIPAAEKAVLEAIAIRRTLPADPYQDADDEAATALFRMMQGDMATGMPILRVAVAKLAATAKTRKQQEGVATAWVILGQNELNLGDSAAADTYMTRGLAAIDAFGSPPSFDTVVGLTNIADYLIRQGDGPRAIAVSRRAVEDRARVQAPNHPDMIDSLGVAGDAELRFGDIAAAGALFRRAVAIADTNTMVQPAMLGRAYQNLGRYYAQIGRADLAIPLLRRAGEQLRNTAVDLAAQMRLDASLAALAAGDVPTATSEADAAVAIARQPNGSPAVLGTILLHQARISIERKDLAAAKRAVDEAVGLYAKALKPQNPRNGDAIAVAGQIEEASGNFGAAAADYDRALRAMGSRQQSHPSLIATQAFVARARLRDAALAPAAWPDARKAADSQTGLFVTQAQLAGAGQSTDRRFVFDIALDAAWARR